jgi:hypothetical protein
MGRMAGTGFTSVRSGIGADMERRISTCDSARWTLSLKVARLSGISGTGSALELYSGCLMARGVPGRALRDFDEPFPDEPFPDEPESEWVGSVGEFLAIILPIKLVDCSVGTFDSVLDRRSVGGVPTESDLLCKVKWPGSGMAGADGLRASESRRASSSAAAISCFFRSDSDCSFAPELASW